MVNLLIALSFGVQRLQFEQRIGFTWPRPFLLRPLFGSSVYKITGTSNRVCSYLLALFLTILNVEIAQVCAFKVLAEVYEIALMQTY
jgi:hypothetical protein